MTTRVLVLTALALSAQLAACGSRGPELPSSPPSTQELAGRWGLTVDAHRLTGKRYGMPANELYLDLQEGGAARWYEVPGPTWGEDAADVLARFEGEGRWSVGAAGARPVVEVVDSAGGLHVVGILGAQPPYHLALEEAQPGKDPKRLELTRAEAVPGGL